MGAVRLTLCHPIESRDGTLNADSKMKNMVVENVEGEMVAVKRPGVTLGHQLPPGLAQGLFSLNGMAYGIVNDELYGPFTIDGGGGGVGHKAFPNPGKYPLTVTTGSTGDFPSGEYIISFVIYDKTTLEHSDRKNILYKGLGSKSRFYVKSYVALPDGYAYRVEIKTISQVRYFQFESLGTADIYSVSEQTSAVDVVASGSKNIVGNTYLSNDGLTAGWSASLSGSLYENTWPMELLCGRYSGSSALDAYSNASVLLELPIGVIGSVINFTTPASAGEYFVILQNAKGAAYPSCCYKLQANTSYQYLNVNTNTFSLNNAMFESFFNTPITWDIDS